MDVVVQVDGGARGNPGPAGAGVVIRDGDGALLHEGAYFLGRGTNNFAEYSALIRALERAATLGPLNLRILSDSELLVRQLTGEYQVKSPALAPLFRQVQVLLLRFPRWQVQHVRREENRRADELANLAMDREADIVVFDADGRSGANASIRPSAAAPPDPAAAAPRPAPAKRGARKDEAAAPTHAASRAITGQPTAHVVVATPPAAGACPAPLAAGATVAVGTTTPAGLCLFAAHALLPTLTAMHNADAADFGRIPTMTLRCGRDGCGAVFHVSPAGDYNGEH